MNTCAPLVLHTLRMSANKQCKQQSCSHHMPVTFAKSVHQHVTQIWVNTNIGNRGERKVLQLPCILLFGNAQLLSTSITQPSLILKVQSHLLLLVPLEGGPRNKGGPRLFQCTCVEGICYLAALEDTYEPAVGCPAHAAALLSALVRPQPCWSHLALRTQTQS